MSQSTFQTGGAARALFLLFHKDRGVKRTGAQQLQNFSLLLVGFFLTVAALAVRHHYLLASAGTLGEFPQHFSIRGMARVIWLMA